MYVGTTWYWFWDLLNPSQISFTFSPRAPPWACHQLTVTGAARTRAGTISTTTAARAILKLRKCFMGSSFSLSSV